MKVLHLIGGDLGRGAALGAYWLHKELLNLGVESKILTNSSETYIDKSVTSIVSDLRGKILNTVRRVADNFLNKLYLNRKKVIFSAGLFGCDFTKTKIYKNADIIHLHWICRGFVNIKHMEKVEKPLVWTMRDMWPMTGGCHYSIDCKRYKANCGRCPQLGSTHKKDLSSLLLQRKMKWIPKTTKLIGISDWLSDCAKQSSLFSDFDVQTIYNCVSVREFFPVEKLLARKSLGLPEDKIIVLAGAQNFDDFYKGFDIYLQAVKNLVSNPLLLFYGKLDCSALDAIGRDYVNLGFLYHTSSLRLAYSAADVFVAPSRMDAFCKALAESMACGTPVVCFDATGPKDIVDHKKNGYKAKPFEPVDLARGVEWIIGDMIRHRKIALKAKEKVACLFDSRIIAKKYIKLYRALLINAN
jgi:glycosyltransferase involved in cell wall biosynthesis